MNKVYFSETAERLEAPRHAHRCVCRLQFQCVSTRCRDDQFALCPNCRAYVLVQLNRLVQAFLFAAVAYLLWSGK